MNKRFLGLIVFALGVSGIASLLVYRVLASRLGTAAAPVRESQVLVMTRDVKMGALLTPDDVRAARWRGQVPRQAVTSLDKIEGRAAMAPLHEGDMVLDNLLSPKGAGVGLAVKIPEGMRAVAVRVDDIVGVAGFVLPGMHVDVVACGLPPGPSSGRDTLGTQSRTVLQNLEVLSAGKNIEHDNEGKPVTTNVVNLLVTPAQAQTLILASNETRVQLALRNPNDAGTPDAPRTAAIDLFTGGQAAQPQKVARRTARPLPAGPMKAAMEKVAVPVTMEVISGGKRAEATVGQRFEERPREEKGTR